MPGRYAAPRCAALLKPSQHMASPALKPNGRRHMQKRKKKQKKNTKKTETTQIHERPQVTFDVKPHAVCDSLRSNSVLRLTRELY